MNTKVTSAIKIVKTRLHMVVYALNHPYKLEDNMPSYSTSILKTSSGNPSNSKENQIINILHKSSKYDRLIKMYLSYLDVLDEKLEHVIRLRFFEGYKVKQIAEDLNVEEKRVFLILNKAYIVLATLDPDIDYSVNDFKEYLLATYKLPYTLRETVMVTLSKNDEETIEILNVLNLDLKNALWSYKKQEKLNSNDYRNLSRAVYMFAYMHSNIDMSYHEFVLLMKKTGNGYMKYVQTAFKHHSGAK